MLYILTLWAFAQAQVPTVDATDFKPGKSWTWDYFREDGGLYSTETYRVLANHSGQLQIEMSTQVPGQRSFRSHHRLVVPLARCLESYRNPVHRVPWSFEMYYRNAKGRWEQTFPNTTLAFEEKFNCNGHVNDSRDYLTVFREDAFMHKFSRVVEGSWFSLTGPDAGVLLEKNFDHGIGSSRFLMKRRPTSPNARQPHPAKPLKSRAKPDRG